ncbi:MULTISPECIES: hypothetical protein [Staphylococcus]|uniref:hypothetical protein n=1 Tax=Staphylococcus TaxID=1279 RepID=UPI0015F8C5DE|nr:MULTISPECIES: hypothetical protein [Staphylococcus]MDW8564347.1 hypothetical protein [Staphylococcus shinii]MDW8567578.1 hypothetical protein [Staphylococcus shinii]MEC5301031.1 hypothetical protein [Staphylococcus shinii]
MNNYLTVAVILFILLIPEFIRIMRILHLKRNGIKYIGNGQYEKIGDKKYKWYEWMR